MKKQSWIIVLFMIFGVFVSIDRSGTTVAKGPPEIMPLPKSMATNTSVSINLNTGEAEVSGIGDVSIQIEQPTKDIKFVETRTEYVTKVEYVTDIARTTKLLNKFLPLEKPMLNLEKINPKRD